MPLGAEKAGLFGASATTGNYWGDGSDGAVTTSGNVTHTVANKNGSYDGDMYVANYTSLSIGAGHTMTVDQPCRGLLVYVKGDCTISGTLSMALKGGAANPTTSGGNDSSAVSSTGIRLPMLKSSSSETLAAADFAGCGSAAVAAVANQPGIDGDGKIYTIARAGASGGASASTPSCGNSGSPGGNAGNTGSAGSSSLPISTGGGGSGAAGTAFIGDGTVGVVTITSEGSGYTTAPTVTITGPVGVGTTATAEAVVSSAGTITSINLTNAGAGYTSSPTITIGDPSLDNSGNFAFNEVITGSITGVTGRVRTWNASTNVLEVTNVSGMFSIGEDLTGSSTGAVHALRLISEDPPEDGFADNINIETEADAILDFTEQNPFGIP